MARGRVAPDNDQTPGRRQENVTLPAIPNIESGYLTVTAILWYRKANPEFLDRVYGAEATIRSPITELTRATTRIRIFTARCANALKNACHSRSESGTVLAITQPA